MTTNSPSSGFSPFSEYHPAWEGREFSKEEFQETIEELATKEIDDALIVDNHTVKKASPVVRIWNVIKGFFGFENKTDPVKVNYELLKLLRYAETHHFLDDAAIKSTLANVVDKLTKDRRYAEIASVYENAIRSDNPTVHASETDKQVHRYFTDHSNRLEESFWTKIFHEFITPVHGVSASVNTNHARIYLDEKNYELALQSIDEAIDTESNFERLALRAEILLQKAKETLAENRDKAIDDFDQACDAYVEACEHFEAVLPREEWTEEQRELDQKRVNAFLIITGLYLRDGRTDSAITHLRMVHHDHNDRTAELEEVVENYNLLGDQPLALGEFYFALSDSDEKQKSALAERGFNLLLLQDLKDAAPLLKKQFIEKGLVLADAETDRWEKADILVKIGAAAVDASEKLKERVVHAIQAHAKQCVKENDNTRAKALYGLANELHPSDPTTLKALAKLALAEEKYHDAQAFNDALLEIEPKEIKHWVRGVEILERSENKAQAVELIKKGLKAFPEDIDLIIKHINLTGHVAGKIEKALEVAKKVADDEKNNYSIRRQIANMYHKKMNLEEAKKYLLEALTLVKNRRNVEEVEAHTDTLKQMVEIAAMQKDYKAATGLCDDLIASASEDPELKAYAASQLFFIAKQALSDNHKKEAIALLSKVYDLVVYTDSPIKTELAELYNTLAQETKETNEVKYFFDRSYKLGSREEGVLHFLAKWHHANGNKDEAKTYYQLLADSESVAEETRTQSQGHLFMFNQDYEKALPIVLKLSRTMASEPVWREYVAICHDNIAKMKTETFPDEAIEHYKYAHKYAEGSLKELISDALFDLGIKLGTNGSHSLSIRALSSAMALARDEQSEDSARFFDIAHSIAKSFLALGEKAHALINFKEALIYDPNHEGVIRNTVELLKENGLAALAEKKYDAAKTALIEAQKLLATVQPSADPEILKGFAEIAAKQKDIKVGEEICSQLLGSAKNDPNVKAFAAEKLFELAQQAQVQNKKADEIRLLSKVYELIVDSNSPLKRELANVYLRLGKETEKSPGGEESASYNYEKAFKLGSKDPAMLEFLANYNRKRGLNHSAAAYFQTLAEEGPADYWMKTKAKARLAMINGKYSDALQQLNYLHEHYPDDAQWRLDLAVCHDNIARQFIQTDPQRAYDNFVTGYIYANDVKKKEIMAGMYDLGMYLSTPFAAHPATMQPAAGIFPQMTMPSQHMQQYQAAYAPGPQPAPLYPTPSAPDFEAMAPSFNPEADFTYGRSAPFGMQQTGYQQPPVNTGALALSMKALNKAMEWIKESKTTEQEGDRLFDIHYSLAKSSLALGKNTEALEHFEKATELCKVSTNKMAMQAEVVAAYTDQLKIHANSAVVSGNIEEAKRFYRKALELNVKDDALRNGYVSFLRGLAYQASDAGKFADAATLYREAINLSRQPQLLVELGKVLENLKQSKEALDLYREAERADKSIKGNAARLEKTAKDQELLDFAKSALAKEHAGDLLGAYKDFIAARDRSGNLQTHHKDILRLAILLGDADFNKGAFDPETYRKEVVKFVKNVTTGEFSQEITKALGAYWGAASKENTDLRAQGQKAKTPKEILEQATKAVSLVMKAYQGKKIPWQIKEASDGLIKEMEAMRQYYVTLAQQAKAVVDTVRASGEAARFDSAMLNAKLEVAPSLTHIYQLVDNSRAIVEKFSKTIASLPPEQRKPFTVPMQKLIQSVRGSAWYESALPYYEEVLKYKADDLGIVNKLITCYEFVGNPHAAFDLYNRYANDPNNVAHLDFNPRIYLEEANRIAETKQKPTLELVKLFMHAGYGYSKTHPIQAKAVVGSYGYALTLLDQHPALLQEDPTLLGKAVENLKSIFSKIDSDATLSYDGYEKDRANAIKKLFKLVPASHKYLLDDKWRAWMLVKVGQYELTLNNVKDARQNFVNALGLDKNLMEANKLLSELDFIEGNFDVLSRRLENLSALTTKDLLIPGYPEAKFIKELPFGAWIWELTVKTDLAWGNLIYLNALYSQLIVHIDVIQNEIKNSGYKNEIQSKLSGWIQDWWSELMNAGKNPATPEQIIRDANKVLEHLNYTNNQNKNYLNAAVRDRMASIINLLGKIRLVAGEIPAEMGRPTTVDQINKGAVANFTTAINHWTRAIGNDPNAETPYLNDARAGF